MREHVEVYLWGKHACFSRPGISPARVSYQIPTASALRYILESISGKPEFRWIPERVEIMNRINTEVFTRNEFKQRAGSTPLRCDVKGQSVGTAPRATVLLRDVLYRVEASAWIAPTSTKPENTPSKYIEIFNRRAAIGQCFRTPYLGCREFTCSFSLQPREATDPLILKDADFGVMLLENMLNPATGEQHRDTASLSMSNGIVEYPVDSIIKFWETYYATI